MPAAAHPEYEFNIETTTGISAPPIGIINRMPINKANIVNIWKNLGSSLLVKHIIKTTIATPIRRLTICCPLNTNGAPLIIPWSLPKAIIEPVKVIAPMAKPKDISNLLALFIDPILPIPYDSGDNNAVYATRTAATPTKLWKAATNWGIAVISIFSAIVVPITPPIKIAVIIRE